MYILASCNDQHGRSDLHLRQQAAAVAPLACALCAMVMEVGAGTSTGRSKQARRQPSLLLANYFSYYPASLAWAK